MMKNHDVGAMPVVEDEGSRRLVGIITQADVATQGRDNKKTGEMVRDISQP